MASARHIGLLWLALAGGSAHAQPSDPAAPGPAPVEPTTPDPTPEPAPSDAETPAPSKPRPRPGNNRAAIDGRADKREDTVLGGTHWRIKTSRGAVHVWIPPGYDRATAGVVVYVHGYHTDADGAWREHNLASQFKASRQNAMFIVPDAPSGQQEGVHWDALTDLRLAIRKANIRLPNGPTVAIGHSGAFRTIRNWVDHKAIAQLILLDALYGGQQAFDEFIGTGKRAKQNRLIMIGSDTAEESVAFTKRYPFAVSRKGMPDSTAGFTKREKRARLLYIKSQYSHMAIVTNGKVIPQLLRLTPLRRL